MSARARRRRRMRRATPDNFIAYARRFAEGAPEPVPCHWFGSDFHDAGESFCYDCALALAKSKGLDDDEAETVIDGGWSIEHDSVEHCTTCGVRLEGSLTDYGFEEEIDHWRLYGPPADAYGWDLLCDAMGHVSSYRDDRSIFEWFERPIDKLNASIFDRWLSAWRIVGPMIRSHQRATRMGA